MRYYITMRMKNTQIHATIWVDLKNNVGAKVDTKEHVQDDSVYISYNRPN